MKILICNIAIRQTPDSFPPIACTTLCNVLIKSGYNPIFYNIDAQRPSPEKLSEYFKTEQFNIVGISAVVSTSYRYTKDLADIIKNVSPKTQIILGGNLAAAYEVILRKCQVDVCVIGEGEKVLVNLVRHFEKHGSLASNSQELRKIKGIAFLDTDDTCKFTGHESLISGDEIEQPDYELLERFSNIDQYILDPKTRYDFAYDIRSAAPCRNGKKMARIFTSKGCINRCTFCHRWIEGYRIIPVEKVISAIKYLMDRYNVGFFCISDECFGESKPWLEEFIRLVKPLNVLFQIAGMRVSVVKNDNTIIRRLKEAGLTAVYFGMESGSGKILSVMEKNTSRDENLIASKICLEAGVYTVIQLVIGMPGENEQTINETIDFVKKATVNSLTSQLSVNYLQALPGTPSYEFLRAYGFLGKTLEDEEQYLLNISDINAAEFKQYVNVSEEVLSKVKLWKTKIVLLTEINYLKHHKWKFPAEWNRAYCPDKMTNINLSSRAKLFLKSRIITYKIIDLMDGLFWGIILFGNRYALYGVTKALLITLGLIEEYRSRFKIESKSLRKTLLENKVDKH